MSRFFNAAATCGGCGVSVTIEFPASVNAGRRPDLRQSILDGTLYRHDCEACGRTLGFEPHMTYLDIERGLWILAHASGEACRWLQHEAEALELCDQAFGGVARALKPAVTRIVFGWPALTEKILCRDLGISDATVEIAKLAMIRNGVLPALDTRLDLRLVGRDGRTLSFGVIDPATDGVGSAAEVSQDLLDAIEAAPARWEAAGKLVVGSMYVDVGRVLHAA